jgi:aminoglycoside phosphotransferase family enzyme/predicted kinase
MTQAPPASSPAHTHDTLTTHLGELLAHPAVGGGPVEVQVVQTHISTVLLAGDFAYKLKRPVRLPFLDFSTLERRQHFLQEELRLNQRTAPELYLDLLPVTGRPDAPRLGGSGPVIDWTLRMRRFGPGGGLHALAEAGALLSGHIDALADHLAAFHLSLPPSAAVPGSSPQRWASDSLDEITASPQRPASFTPADIAHLRAQLLPRLAAPRPSEAQRQQAGWVRECHGDLHLGNLVEWQGRVLAFDALEFDPALRHIDVVADLAFPFMDLLAHGLPGLAWRLVNRHVEQTGDFEGLCQLPTLAAYRALVRAKVALLSPDGAAGFQRYWPLAQRLLQHTRPQLVLVCGLSGSGKSTLALMLAQALGAVRLRSDVERKRLFGLLPTARPDPTLGLYTQEATQRTYARLGELAHTLLSGGLSVVVDAASLRQHERAALRAIALACNASFVLVSCEAPAERLQARIMARQATNQDASDADLSVLALQQRVVEPLPADWAVFSHRVDNSGDLDALAAQVSALASALVQNMRP